MDERVIFKPREDKSKERKKLGKPEILTPEMFFLLLRLFEEYYFLAKAFICRQKLVTS